MIDASSRLAMNKGIEIHKAIQGKLAGIPINELNIDLVSYPEIILLYQYYEAEGIEILEGEKQLHLLLPEQGIILAGKLDGIIKSGRRCVETTQSHRDSIRSEEINLLEIKTSRFKLADDELVLSKWDIDRQLSMYSLLAHRNNINHTGIIVDYLRTPSLKQKKNEPNNDFLQRINENIANNLDTYYGKIAVTRSEEQDAECLEETLQEISLIKSCRKRNIWPKTGEACNEYHKLCLYNQLCRSETDISQYAKRGQQHPELDETLFPKITPIF